MKILTETSAPSGTYQLTITGAGGGKLRYATVVLAIDVSKTASTLTISANPSTLNREESVTVSGKLTPAQATTVVLTYQRPDGFEMTKRLTTTSAGTYTDTVKPEMPGIWSVKSSWQGDEKHFPTESSAANFLVQVPEESPWPLLVAVITIVLAVAIAALIMKRRDRSAAGKLGAVQIEKKYCAKCGSEIPEGSSYCMKCGEKHKE
ncbi:MAG: zinc ribbon domain-containing protein [Candidatus Bathyarchaeia archaeon]